MRNQRERKNKSGGAIMPALLAIILAVSAAGEEIISSPAAASIVFSIIVLLVFFAGVFIAVKKLVKKAGARGGEYNSPRKGKFSFKADPAEDKVSVASKSMGGPVVYNPRSAEELFRRDHEKRISQLSVFLKNGIIDKKEYEILKERYEKLSYERN